MHVTMFDWILSKPHLNKTSLEQILSWTKPSLVILKKTLKYVLRNNNNNLGNITNTFLESNLNYISNCVSMKQFLNKFPIVLIFDEAINDNQQGWYIINVRAFGLDGFYPRGVLTGIELHTELKATPVMIFRSFQIHCIIIYFAQLSFCPVYCLINGIYETIFAANRKYVTRITNQSNEFKILF